MHVDKKLLPPCASLLRAGPSHYAKKSGGAVRGRIESLDGGSLDGVEVAVHPAKIYKGLLLVDDQTDLFVKPNSSGEFSIHLPRGQLVQLAVAGKGYQGVASVFEGGEHCVRVLLAPR